MSDYILRVTAFDGMIRAFFATSQDCVQTACDKHHTTPVATATLGRLLTAGAMMGLMLKGEKDKLTLELKGDGPGGKVLVTADNQGKVKGFITYPEANVPNKPNGKLNVSALVGKGTLNVIRDMPFGQPYHGMVEIVSGEIAEDLTYYFAQSEQVPSAVSLGVLVAGTKVWHAGGFILQLMPGASEEATKLLEDKLQGLDSLTTLYSKVESPESLAEFFFGEVGYTINDKIPLSFHCDCSREKVESVLIALGRRELEALLEEDGKADLHCHFCNSNYHFSEEELKCLLKALD